MEPLWRTEYGSWYSIVMKNDLHGSKLVRSSLESDIEINRSKAVTLDCRCDRIELGSSEALDCCAPSRVRTCRCPWSRESERLRGFRSLAVSCTNDKTLVITVQR